MRERERERVTYLWWSVLCTKKLLTILEENDATTADMRRYRARMQTT
jgi:hypothetical protein